MQYVAYFRVSTQRQGSSGLGLDAQRTAVAKYVNGKGQVVAEFVEVESGKRSDRPELTKALVEAKRSGAVLLIAKLDRLARNVAFIANLLESGVEISAADMPEANRFLLHVMAAVAEHEARVISERTKAALAAAKSRGKKLGWSIPSRQEEHKRAVTKAAEVNAAKAQAHASAVFSSVQQLRASGSSLRQVAEAMNKGGVKTARGGRWHPTTVRNILERGPRSLPQNE
jgi:DNA invertase Pin-like site-specific DNA recombinase